MILILGGTTEGRAAVKTIDEAGKPYFYSTRGEGQDVACSKNGIRLSGGMDTRQMTDFCLANGIRLLVDAAHPFATGLHATVAETAEALSLPVVRYERIYPFRSSDIVWCNDYEDAMHRLEEAGVGRLLALTGVQTIGRLRPYWEKHDCIFRILDRESSLRKAAKQGFPASRLVYYDRDTDEDSLYKACLPEAILTKESGLSGGFARKVEAARRCGIRVFAICRPPLPSSFVTVTGNFGLRKEIERLLSGYYELRSGFTTGACATAAAKAALIALLTGEGPSLVSFSLPNGETLSLPVEQAEARENEAEATVVKDAGDDPDVTNGCRIVVAVRFSAQPGIRFLGGEGVGRVTLPGLGLEIGGPAINRTPREMMTKELSALWEGGLEVTVSVPGGEEIARRTFNPKVGVVGGISIIGTSGVVRPFSSEAFVGAIRREVEVCIAVGSPRLVINSGAKSERYVKQAYPDLPPQAFVHYGNFIGETLRIAASLHVPCVTMGIMLGKAVKLAEGHLDTHSHKVTMNKDFLKRVATGAGCSPLAFDKIEQAVLARELWTALPADDAALFFPALLQRCMAHCRPLLPEGSLTILLIDEEGAIPYRL